MPIVTPLANVRCLALALLLAMGVAGAAETGAGDSVKGRLSASEVIKKSGVAGGFCVFPQASKDDAPLLLELAKKPSFIVLAMASDEKVVAQLRAAASDAGLLERSLYVEQGSGTVLPFADRLVDLLVVTELTDAALKSELRTEWSRVIGPGRGTVLFGRAAAAGAGLSKDALTSFAKVLPAATVSSDESGMWAVLHTALPVGSNAWTHRLHAADNSQVSSDTTLKAPFLTQWWGLPRQEGFWGTTVVACNGRMFTIRGSRGTNEQVTMTARSQNNGVILWQRDLSQKGPKGERLLHGGYVPGRSCTFATDDSLFIVEHHAVMQLDAETGEIRTRIEGPKPEGQIKWIAGSGKMLVMLAGEIDGVTPISYQTVSNTPVGRELAVYDLESNKVLWHETVAGDIDERMIVVRDGQLYYLAQGVGVVGRDVKTGNVVWTDSDADVQTEFKTPELKVIKEFLVSLPVLSALPEELVFRAKWVKNTIVLSRKDGAILWKKPTEGGSYRGLTACPVGNLWIGGGKPLDLKTGAPVTGPNFISSGCGPTTGTPDYLITCFGKVMDIKTQKVVRFEDIKSPCDVGTIVSDGNMITMPSECGCYFEMKGYRTLASAGSITPHTAGPWKERLTVADPAEPAALAPTDADWPSYRHDAQRSGASASTIGFAGVAAKILWQWDAPGSGAHTSPYPFSIGQNVRPDFVSTAPVAADGLVIFGSPDGLIRCLKADSGTEVWNFATHSLLFKPPTIWQGRVLVGGGDGHIYCLSAQSGKLLWQLQAAPHDRRIFWYGHLISTWPVMTGVAVQDGIGYAIAGYQKENGLHAYAFDPKTGQVIWENDAAGSGGAGGPAAGFSSGGSLAVGQGKLWTPAGCYDIKSGEPKALSGQFGGEVAVFDAWVIKGGRRISETEDTLFKPMGQSGFAASNVDPKLGIATLSDAGVALPAWDASDVLLPPRAVSGSLTLTPVAAFTKWMSDFPAAHVAYEKAPKESKPKLTELPDLKTWASDVVTPAAFALTKDQAVVAYSDGKKHHVSGYLRADGKKAWTIDIPDQPAMNGIAVDREGRVLVTLCNGGVVCIGK